MRLTTVGAMSSPRGPLPPSVYWRRRVFVLGVAFALVFIIARWLTAGSDASSDDAGAKQAGAGVPATQTVTAGAEDPTDAGSAGTSGAATGTTPTGPVGPTTPTLAPPQGVCSPSDIVITPSVPSGAVAGRDVPLRLSLQTVTAEACTWEVGPRSLAVRISRDGSSVWSSRQCPRSVPRQSVVVRRAVATVVELTWKDARESADGCTTGAGWVRPGDFTIAAAALGGEPGQAEFTLGSPAPETIPVSPKSTPTKQPKKPKTPVN